MTEGADRRLPLRASREEQILLFLVAHGYSNGRIGRVLGISEEAAKGRVRKLLVRFQVVNRPHLVATALRLGVLPANLIMSRRSEETVDMPEGLLPVRSVVVVSPESMVRGPEYRAQIVGYSRDGTRYHVGAELTPGVFARGGSWASPHEVRIDPLSGGTSA